MPKKNTKNVASDDAILTVILLSVLFPGLGQLYNREFGKALLIWVALVLFAMLSLILIGIPLLILLYLYSIYDAYVVAKARAEH